MSEHAEDGRTSSAGMAGPPAEITPPLKWAGGKRWLLPVLGRLWQDHRGCRLVEPFVGGMAVALGLLPDEAVLNDVNDHLINFYRWLQKGLVVDIGMKNDKALYYGHRRRFNDLIRMGWHRTREAAGLFYYLNRTGYNGLCRFNRRGEYNVPFGRYRTIRYTHDFFSYAPILEGWQFLCLDFERLELRESDFIYADPPYDVPFRSYSAHGFEWDDQVRLAEWLAGHRGPVVASNQATPRILELYARLGFDMRILDGPRRISCTGDRTPAQEMLATRGV